MSGPKRKTTKQDWIFRAFVFVCILASYFVIVRTKPDNMAIGSQTTATVSASIENKSSIEEGSTVSASDSESQSTSTSTSKKASDNTSTSESVSTSTGQNTESVDQVVETVDYKFRNDSMLTSHYEKHGIEMGFDSKEAYEAAASAVINNPQALHKIEAEDGDDVYYVEATNEFVVLSTDGYIRTYFLPDSGKKYFDKQ